MERISDRRGAEGAEDGNTRENGKAMAMVGWGHLCLPFLRPRSGGASRFAEDLRRR
jgi:hypothetical protein